MVKLKALVKKLKEALSDESIFVNKKTGEIKGIEEYYLRFQEGGEKGKLAKWQMDIVADGKSILGDKEFISCNIKGELKEYFLMEEFIKNNLSEEERLEIEFIINGENRFKRFELAILGTYYENLWDIFIEEKIEEECKRWLYSREINYY